MKYIVGIFIFISLVLSLSFAFFTNYTFPNVFPTNFTLSYIKNIGINSSVIFQTITVGVLNAIISTSLGFLVAYSVTRYNSKANKYIMNFLQIPLFFPTISMFVGVHMIMLRLNIANSLIGVIISHIFLSIPYAVNIGISFFIRIPKNYQYISELLGASKLITFRKILLPLLRPGISLSFSMTFLISTSEYFATYLIGGGRVRTIAGDIYPYVANFDLQNSALLMLIFITINLIFFGIFNLKK